MIPALNLNGRHWPSASEPRRRAVLGEFSIPAFAANDYEEVIKKFTGGKTPTVGRVRIDAPEIAENGNTVPDDDIGRKPDDARVLRHRCAGGG